MIIDDIKNARDGDWIKASFRSSDGVWHAFEGIAWTHLDDLHVGNTRVHWDGGGIPEDVKVESIERRTPPLPTEPGSVILDVLVEGDEPCPQPHFLINGQWVCADEGGQLEIAPDEIRSFTLAKVVPA